MAEQEQNVPGYLQTVAQTNVDNNTGHSNDICDEEHNINCESSETTDILFKYQQRYNKRKKHDKDSNQQPTKRNYGESPRTSTTQYPSCFKECIPLLCAWFGYVAHMTVALLPNNVFGGNIDTTEFYQTYSIDIAPANWHEIQFGIEILWQGILLTYLSLIIAEHTLKLFPNSFYYGLCIANIGMAIWDICTEHKSFLGRMITWLCIAMCLSWSNYILLRHVYNTYDVTKYMLPRFRLDPCTSSDNRMIDDNFENEDYIPPFGIEDTGATSRNINAILRMKGGGSVNSSPTSMSMAPSVAEKLVYDAAEAATAQNDNDWLDTKIKDITRIKYSGLIGIVFNGISFFLSVVVINLWVQLGVWLVYKCDVDDDIASIIVLSIIFVTITIYYCFDFYCFEKYFVDNFATHVVFCMMFAAMISKHFFQELDNDTESICDCLQMIGFCVVVVMAILKIVKAVRIHRKYKKGVKNNGVHDQYKRVI